MSLDLSELPPLRERGGTWVTRCPACAEQGRDTDGDNLTFFNPDGTGAYACAANQGDAAHRKRIYALAGIAANATPRPAPPPRARPVRPLPPLRTPTAAELAQIARSRGWPTTDGLDLLVTRGQLFTADIYDDGQTWPAWVVTDPTRANAQARRIDSGKWGGLDAKAKSLPGTTTKRAIGAPLIGTRPQVWLMEGTPDLCAAPIVARLARLDLELIAFVCITGAGNDLHPDDLPHFAGKNVTIAMHHDADHGNGAEAARRWARQLYAADTAKVCGFDFSGTGGKDLADYLCHLADPIATASASSCVAVTLGNALPSAAPHEAKALLTRPALVPLETPFVDGQRYREAGAFEIKTRLPLYFHAPKGDTLRAHGLLALRSLLEN